MPTSEPETHRDLLEAIGTGWAFAGLEPREVLDVNAFGSVLVRDVDGHFWRIIPELLSCELLATTEAEFRRQIGAREFQEDWRMGHLVEMATAALGTPGEGRCFCLKVPAALGAPYEVENFATLTVAELLAVSGHIAERIQGLPEGTPVDQIVD